MYLSWSLHWSMMLATPNSKLTYICTDYLKYFFSEGPNLQSKQYNTHVPDYRLERQWIEKLQLWQPHATVSLTSCWLHLNSWLYWFRAAHVFWQLIILAMPFLEALWLMNRDGFCSKLPPTDVADDGRRSGHGSWTFADLQVWMAAGLWWWLDNRYVPNVWLACGFCSEFSLTMNQLILDWGRKITQWVNLHTTSWVAHIRLLMPRYTYQWQPLKNYQKKLWLTRADGHFIGDKVQCLKQGLKICAHCLRIKVAHCIHMITIIIGGTPKHSPCTAWSHTHTHIIYKERTCLGKMSKEAN